MVLKLISYFFMKMMHQYISRFMNHKKLVICGNRDINICVYSPGSHEYTYYDKDQLVNIEYGIAFKVIKKNETFTHVYFAHSVCNDAFNTYYESNGNNDTFCKMLNNFLMKPCDKVGMLQTWSYADIMCITKID